MALDDILSVVAAGSIEEGLARQIDFSRLPRHLAVIMDGDGRWARLRGLPRIRGHSAGMTSVREAIEGAIEAGVGIVTLFAFSQENWNRPAAEVVALMQLLQRYVIKEREELKRQGVRVHVHGDLDRLSPAPRRAIAHIEAIFDLDRA